MTGNQYGVPDPRVGRRPGDGVRASGRALAGNVADLALVLVWVLLWLVVPSVLGQLVAGPAGLATGLGIGVLALAVDGVIGLFRSRPLLTAWLHLFGRR